MNRFRSDRMKLIREGMSVPVEPEDRERLLRRLRADRESVESLVQRTEFPDVHPEEPGTVELFNALARD